MSETSSETTELGNPDTATIDAVAVSFGRLFNEPITQMPEDLYIPPEAMRVFLETFEGPLDLLLYLIRRQNLDILTINVATMRKIPARSLYGAYKSTNASRKPLKRWTHCPVWAVTGLAFRQDYPRWNPA